MLTLERESLQAKVKEAAEKYGAKRSSLIPLLQAVQAEKGYISDIAMQEIADALNIAPIEVESVASFYHFLNTEPTGKYVIRLCKNITCDMLGKEAIARQFENELGIEFGETTVDKMFTLEWTNCLGMCDQGPAVLVNDTTMYTHVTPLKVAEIIEDCRTCFGGSDPEVVDFDANVMKKGPILNGPTAVNAGLKKALTKSRADVIADLRDANLRGRGGAGFPTSLKWQLAGAVKDEQKFVVCNADEGEPGTFKDRLLLMEYAEQLLDGMTIGGYAIGAEEGIIYLRAEYNFMKKNLEAAIAKRREGGLLGKNVGGKEGFNFDVDIHMGAGAYICGEETALIESIEGKRGEPRNRPPFPVNTGLNGHPTIVNNVETFVDVCLILDRGAAWFKENGTEQSTGTKLFSVSGACARPGIYELPMGVTVAELLKEVGGEEAKAVQVGGASGTCLAAKDFGRKIAFEDVASGGSIMVFGPEQDMLEVAENFMEFFVEESCGKCAPCRKGTFALLKGIDLLLDGECSIAYLNNMKELGKTMQLSCVCGLGQSAPNAFLSIVENFTDEILGR